MVIGLGFGVYGGRVRVGVRAGVRVGVRVVGCGLWAWVRVRVRARVWVWVRARVWVWVRLAWTKKVMSPTIVIERTKHG